MTQDFQSMCDAPADRPIAVARGVLESLGDDPLGFCRDQGELRVRGARYDVVLAGGAVRVEQRARWQESAGAEALAIHEALRPCLDQAHATQLRGGDRSLSFAAGRRCIEVLAEGAGAYSVRVCSRGGSHKIIACHLGVAAAHLRHVVEGALS